MQKPERGCTQPRLYAEWFPEAGIREARMLAIAAYSENGLPERAMQDVRAHLGSCASCAGELAEFEREDGPEFARAVCPSSDTLDRYLFDRDSLSEPEVRATMEHLELCPLCREESAWLESVEKPEVLRFAPQRSLLPPFLAAAATIFLAVAAFLFWQSHNPGLPEDQLRALAVIKEPEQIDYSELDLTSPGLSPQMQQVYDRAVRNFRNGNYESASGEFERVLANAPGHSGAVYLLGYSYYKMNHPEKAFALCERAERMTPHAYERCMFLVHIALKTGHFDRALLEITALYHGGPEDPGIRDMYRKITALMPHKL